MTPRLALKQRPDAAFEKLYRQHVGDVYRYTLAVLGNPADAEDVTQTTFLNAYRAFHAGERPRKPTAWLRTIAHNVCRQRWRQASRRPREVQELDEMSGDGALVEEEPDGHSAADITRALQTLPFNQRTALVMREMEGRRQAEIAKELDLSESAVEALLFRARRAMREQLESSITCGEAARAISRQLDRSLSREERSSLRAHLRVCDECSAFARQARAQRGAMKALGAIPLPAALWTWSAGKGGAAASAGAAGSAAGGSAAGSGAAAAALGGTGVALGIKVAAGVAVVALVAGGGERILSGSGAGDRGGSGNGAVAKQAGRAAAARRAITLHTRRAIDPGAARLGRNGPAADTGPGTTRAARPPGRHGPAATGPGPNGSPVRAHGQPAQAHGTPAPSNGNATRAHGAPSQSNGTPTRAHGTPTRSNGAPTRAHGSPAPSGGGSHPAHSQPPQSNGSPTRAHGAPPKQQDDPPPP